MHIQEHIELSGYTTLHVGGLARYFASAASETELREALTFAEEKNIPVYILGGGSNVLISDEGVSGLVIHIANKGIEESVSDDTVELTVGAGELFDDVVAYTVSHNWWGLENLSHIPGTVGATPVQNVGAYGVEVGDYIREVHAFNRETKKVEVLTKQQCAFAYRHSFFKTELGKKYIIVSIIFELSKKPTQKLSYKDLTTFFAEQQTPTQEEIRNAIISIRSKKFPNWHEVGTAGSFFKNPTVSKEQYQELLKVWPQLPGFETVTGEIKLSLGWILDKVLQLKGYTEGHVATYEAQALVLIANEGATASEIEQFANDIIAKIKKETGIIVEWEVTKIK